MKTAAEINKRLHEIGDEMATKHRFTPTTTAPALIAEQDALRIAYREALAREAEEARDAEEIARRAGAARFAKAQAEREARIAKAVTEANR